MIDRLELKLPITEKQPETRKFIPTTYSLAIKITLVGEEVK